MNRILGFACDPGGANILRALQEPLQSSDYALELWGKEKALTILGPSCRDLCEQVSHTTPAAIRHFLLSRAPDLVLTGTSGDDFTERHLWSQANVEKIPSVAVLDQWINYGLRFSPYRLSEAQSYASAPQWPYLPDRICVMDQLAKDEMIAEGLPSEILSITGQPHLEALVHRLHAIDRRAARESLGVTSKEILLLFVSEPLEQAYGGAEALGFTQLTVLGELLNVLTVLEGQSKTPVTLLIKPHPREDAQALKNLLQRTALERIKVRLVETVGSEHLLAAADLVIGMASLMLVEAALLGKPLLCVQTNGHDPNPCVLCRSGQLRPIRRQQDLVAALSQILSGELPPGTQFTATEPAASAVIKVIEECLAPT